MLQTIRRLSPALAASCALLLAPATAQDADRPADGKALVEAARERLAAVGYRLPATVTCEDRTGAQVVEDLDDQQDLLFPPGTFRLQHALFDALRLRPGPDAAAMRQAAVAGMARGLSAYYDPVGKAFVLLATTTRETSEALSGGLMPLVTHELVHGCQDARAGGIAAFFDARTATLDSALARRIVVEGEAELVAALALGGEQAMAAFDRSESQARLNSLFVGELTAEIYAAGRALTKARYDDGGLDAVRALWQRAPASSEQALHPQKLGRDAPTAVEVVAVDGLEVGASSTLGELMTFGLLRQLKVSQADARRVAAGWDGDVVTVYDRGDERAVAVAWRTVWDRDEDAADFEQALRDRGRVGGRRVLHREGRVVDWLCCRDAELRARVHAAVAAGRPAPEADPADAESTAAVEAELAARAAATATSADGDGWRHTALGLTVPIPDGWEVDEVNGTEMLFQTASRSTGFAINVNVTASPQGPMTDLDAMETLTRRQMERAKLTLDRMEQGERGEVPVLLAAYHGRIGRMAPMRFTVVGYLRDGQQIYVTATCLESQWEANRKAIEALLEGVRIAPE